MTGEGWRDDWWYERLCDACKQGHHLPTDTHPGCDWASGCECAVELWLTDFEEAP